MNEAVTFPIHIITMEYLELGFMALITQKTSTRIKGSGDLYVKRR
jgi:hypothetical protein